MSLSKLAVQTVGSSPRCELGMELKAALHDELRSMGRVSVLYLLGAARSGSSLLTGLLGELDGVFAAAEMRLLWWGFDARLCGCGARVSECPVWGAVIDSAKQASGLARPEELLALQARTTRTRHLIGLLAGGGNPRNEGSARYLRTMTRMYLRLADETGAAVIVDSSKSGAEAALLSNSEDINVKIVHVVRDPRAVAYSWQRVGHRNPESRRSIPSAVATWLASNVSAELAARRYGPMSKTRLRYEDYVVNPEGVLASLAALAGLPSGNIAGLCDDSRRRTSVHMVGGNRLRFDKEVLKPRLDSEWVDKLAAADANFVAAATLPWLLRYGYPLRPQVTMLERGFA